MQKLLPTIIILLMAATSQVSARDPLDKSGPANEGCIEETVINQRRVHNYLADLIANPLHSERPALIEVGDCKNDLALKECKGLMDQAEQLVQSGTPERIKTPQFKYTGKE